MLISTRYLRRNEEEGEEEEAVCDSTVDDSDLTDSDTVENCKNRVSRFRDALRIIRKSFENIGFNCGGKHVVEVRPAIIAIWTLLWPYPIAPIKYVRADCPGRPTRAAHRYKVRFNRCHPLLAVVVIQQMEFRFPSVVARVRG